MATKAELQAKLNALQNAGVKGAVKGNGFRAVKNPPKNGIGDGFYALELTIGGTTVQHTARKWAAIMQAINAGILTPQAIANEDSKIPVPAATKGARAARQDGRMYL